MRTLLLLAEEMSVAHQRAAVPDRLPAIVCLRGSALSHVSILARAMGIPTIMGLGDRPIGGLRLRDHRRRLSGPGVQPIPTVPCAGNTTN
ncbi:MAG: hypothetical protein IPI57_07240 [Candidatus Competibacteraceae bacterium]|nr:hypothetical protein [Candidatus Competibacteraceae bacterium]